MKMVVALGGNAGGSSLGAGPVVDLILVLVVAAVSLRWGVILLIVLGAVE